MKSKLAVWHFGWHRERNISTLKGISISFSDIKNEALLKIRMLIFLRNIGTTLELTIKIIKIKTFYT